MEFKIEGNAFQHKDDLQSYGCSWNQKERCWITGNLKKTEILYKWIESFCEKNNLKLKEANDVK